MTRKGGFGTTADRMAPLNGKKEEELPGKILLSWNPQKKKNFF